MNDRPDSAMAEIALAREAPFALGALEVRPASLELVQDGRRETLERRVMQVLVALARRRGEVVPREELMAAGWGERSVGEDALHRCIVRLHKLETTSATFTLETIRRVGYRLSTPQDEARGLGDVAPPRAAGATIAVLPFVNMSSDPEQEYFSDGLAEELLGQLAQLKDLRVAGRTSSFAFKGQNDDLREIGLKLGVEHILEGSVRKAGNRLRITAQLITCNDGYHLWSQTFDRDLDDVFAIQDEVARAVTNALGVALGVGAQAPDYGGTQSFEAFDRFLKGRFQAGIQLTPEQFKARAHHLRRAVAIDPRYAQAWANLSSLLAFVQGALPAEAAQRLDEEREETARRAIALAPDLPVANVALGWCEADRRNWLGAEAALTRAVQRGPGRDPHSEGIVGAFLTNVGRVREGLTLREAARDADPLWLGWSIHVLGSYLTLGLWERFDSEYRRSQDLEGDRRLIEHLQLRRLALGHADRAAIEAQLERVRSLGGMPEHVLALAGGLMSPREARLALPRTLEGPPIWLFMLAGQAGAYGDNDLAIAALQKAAPDARTIHFQQLWRRELNGVRKDPRFKDLMREVGLAQFWRTSGKWPDCCRPVGDDDFEFIS